MLQLLANQPVNQGMPYMSPIIAVVIMGMVFIAFYVGIYALVSCIVAAKRRTNNDGFFMRAFIKAALIVALVGFMLVNYKVFSFNKGFSKFDLDNTNAEQTIISLISINKIEYYDSPLPNQQPYIIFVETAESNYLFRTDNNGISALSVAGNFVNNVRPQKIAPIPFWIAIIIAAVITFIPSRRRIYLDSNNQPEVNM